MDPKALQYAKTLTRVNGNDTDTYWLEDHGVTVAALAETLNMKRRHVATVLAAIAGQGGTDDPTAIRVFLEMSFTPIEDD